MTRFDGISDEAARKVLLGQADEHGGLGDGLDDLSSRPPPRSEADGESAADDLVRLVLSLVETIRQLMEQQAIRRVESGALSEEQIENLGVTLMQLEDRMTEVKTHFGLAGEDLTLRLGTLQDLQDVLKEGDPAAW